ncbi:hypothetical protein [Streptomyces sp. DB-54]
MERQRFTREGAEQDWKEWAIARSRVGEVLVHVDETAQGPARTDQAASAAEGQAVETAPSTPGAAKPKSQVPVWHEGLDWSVLSVDYQPTASSIARWQYASGRSTRPRIQPGTGNSGRIAAHSASVRSVGYRRSRTPLSAAFPNR